MSSLSNEMVATRFYEAFSRKDAEAMGDCYAAQVHFSDPVFPNLVGEEARKMWRMLCSRSRDLKIEFRLAGSDADRVLVEWQAWYPFGKTGRPVHNVIQAELRFAGGKIISHRDRFSFWRWSRQALGPVGFFLGWSPFLRAKVQGEVARALKAF